VYKRKRKEKKRKEQEKKLTSNPQILQYLSKNTKILIIFLTIINFKIITKNMLNLLFNKYY